mmetsp:Transcript_44965/g.103975  ORF Transcript_44965/g.103975 Transcript_44965/m.103975 type:complete len:343 (-) Transcript_44965:154-1182(-)
MLPRAIRVQAAQAVLLLAVVRELKTSKDHGCLEHCTVVHVVQQPLHILRFNGLHYLDLWDGEELCPTPLRASIIQAVPHQPQVRQVRDANNVHLRITHSRFGEEADGKDVFLRVRGRKACEEVLLHLLHGVAAVQQLVEEHDLVRGLRGGVAELARGQLRSNVHTIFGLALVLVRRGLHKVHRVRPDKHAAEIGEEHECAFQDAHKDDALPLAPCLDAPCHDTDACLDLLARQDQPVVLVVLEVLGASKRWLHVPVPQVLQETLLAHCRCLQHFPLLSLFGSIASEDLSEDAFHQRRHRQRSNVLHVQPPHIVETRDAHRGCRQRREPLCQQCLLVWQRLFE